MFSIFDKTKNAKGSPEITPEYVGCRSWYGTAIHIRKTTQDDGLALCGYKPLDDLKEETVESVTKGVPLQHSGWHYCSDCAAALTGLSKEELAVRI